MGPRASHHNLTSAKLAQRTGRHYPAPKSSSEWGFSNQRRAFHLSGGLFIDTQDEVLRPPPNNPSLRLTLLSELNIVMLMEYCIIQGCY